MTRNSEDVKRYIEQIYKTGFYRRVGEINRTTGCGYVAAKRAVIDEQHGLAAEEDERRYLDEDEAWSVSTSTWR